MKNWLRIQFYCFFSILFFGFLLVSCSDDKDVSEECRYYRQTKEGKQVSDFVTKNINVKNLQRQIVTECALDPLNASSSSQTQCKDRLLEDFGDKWSCEI